MKEGIHINVSGNLIIISTGLDYSGLGSQPNDRGCVTGFSSSSAYRMRRYLRETKCKYRSMLTLTYPDRYGIDGKRCKDDLRRFIQELRRNSSNEFWGCFWFLEFQRNGRIHFHLFCSDFYDKQWISRIWFRIVGSGDDKHLRAGTRIEQIKHGRKATCSYASKYAAKFEQKLIPEGFGWVGRFWGVQGYRARVSAAIFIEKASPGALEAQNGVKKIISELKSLERSKISKNLSPKLKKQYPRIFAAWVLNENDLKISESIQKRLFLIEMKLAIEQRREPKITEEDIEEVYEQFSYELEIEEKDYYPCPSFV